MNNKKLKTLPSSPWIYQFIDKNNKIIYIWKSVNLKARVNSYFNGKAKLNFAKKKMVEQVADIKTIITNNETESLILENTLIKKHQPKYNILLKDDKNHLYIKITDESIPRILKSRRKTKSWTYFWPYVSTNSVNNILKFIRKIFTYRSCNIVFANTSEQKIAVTPFSWEGEKKIAELMPVMKDRGITIKSTNGLKIPCIDYYIKRCSWPCLLEQDKIDEYLKSIEKIKNFLKWNIGQIIENLEKDMKQFAQKLEFEKAKEVKNIIDSIKSIWEHQIVRDLVEWHYDVINYLERYEKKYIGHIKIRNSKIEWLFNYEIKTKLEENIDDILKTFIERLYAENIEKNKKVIFLISKDIKIKNEEIKNITEIPKIWAKTELLKLCYKNVYEYAYKKHINSLSTKWFTKKTMQNLLEKLWYKQINKTITFECNDISHLSWTHTVASRSVIENWKTANSKYRKFKIKTLESLEIDDFKSLREIIERRLKEIIKLWNLPDLIIIDWWKWQLSSVNKIIQNYQKDFEMLKEIQVCSIAKKEEEIFIVENIIHPWIPSFHTKGRGNDNLEKNINNEFKKIILEKDSLELKLIQKLRDEAHRFAIEFNRSKRIKSMKKNILEDLPWFGPVTRKKVLKEFGSVNNLLEAKKEVLEKILTKSQIETLENHCLI